MRSDCWTPEMYEQLRALYPQHTNKEIEAITGWTVKECQYRAGILGIVKTKETEKRCLTRIEYVPDHEEFIRENFDKHTTRELAALLGFSLNYVRAKCHGMGLYRMELEYWTDEQIQFLVDNYQQIGDKELAEIFNAKWEKKKSWSFKHIEKKRKQRNLKRTKEQIDAIRDRNVEFGRFKNCPVNRWLKYGVSQEGDIRMWRCTNGRYVPFIKVDGKFRHWARYTWEKVNGPVPERYNIIFKDNNPQDYAKGIEVLAMVSNAELSALNSKKSSTGLSDNYIAAMMSLGQPELRDAIKNTPALIDLKRQELLLTRAIKQSEK